MKLILSPTKSLSKDFGFEKQNIITEYSEINFPKKTEQLVKILKKLSSKKISELMKVSANIGDLNYGRFQEFSKEFTVENAMQAILAFTGDAFRGLDARSFDEKDFDFAQENLRILSGLYGVLKPLDLIQPYRLEMGSRLKLSAKDKNLYTYWKETSVDYLNHEMNGELLVNLASNEYFKSIDLKRLNSDVLTINFKDFKNGEYKTIMTYAKFARGLMSKFIIKNKITNPEEIRSFDYENYVFNNQLSTNNNWFFTRG